MHYQPPPIAAGSAASPLKAKLFAGGEGRDAAVLLVRAFSGGCLLAVLALWPDVAAAQGASSQDQGANTGNDLFRPPPNLFQMMYNYRTAPGSGSTPGSTRDVTTDTLNLRTLKKLLEDTITGPCDHRHLNEEVPFLQGIVPSTENLAIAFFRRIAAHLKTGRLTQVRLYETPRNFADYFGP